MHRSSVYMFLSVVLVVCMASMIAPKALSASVLGMFPSVVLLVEFKASMIAPKALSASMLGIHVSKCRLGSMHGFDDCS